MDAKELKETVGGMYANMDYFQFCAYLELDPEYSEQYWKAWQNLVHGLGTFDTRRVQKILDYKKEA